MMSMGKTLLAAGALSAAALAWSAPANAAYSVQVTEASGLGAFAATYASGVALYGQADASYAQFTYTGAINFSNTATQNTSNQGDLNSAFFTTGTITGFTSAAGIGGKAPTGTVYERNPSASYADLSHFLNVSGSVAGYGWGSLYAFTDTGAYGGRTLTITHDDGVSVYINGDYAHAIGLTTAGPTTSVTDSVLLPGNTMSYTIVYARENGTPSILQAGLSPAVPEPASWAMMISGFGLVGGAMRRTRKVAAFA